MTKPKMIKDVKELGDERFNTNLKSVYLMVAQLIEEYGEEAQLHFDAYDDYLEVTVTFDREETDKERNQRLAEAKKWKNYKVKQKESKLVNERKEYLRLKKKFEDKDA